MKSKIVFVLPSLEAGGAERVLSFLAKRIDRTRFEPIMLVIGSSNKVAYDTGDAKVCFLNKSRLLFAIPAFFGFLRREKPKVVFSSIGHLNTAAGLLSFYFRNTKFIIREASVISSISQFGSKSFLYDKLSSLAFKKADSIVCQSKDMEIDFKKLYSVSNDKVHVIGNPVTIERLARTRAPKTEQLRLITIGRLSAEKGHERILNSLSQLERDYHYTIIGSGDKEAEIKSHVKSLGMTSKVSFVSYTDDVVSYLIQNDWFLQGSYVEGFPNAVLESCAVGTPVLAFPAPGGTKEIIEQGVNGFILADEKAYVKKLQNLPNLNPDMVIESVYQRYDSKVILEIYEKLLLNTINQ
ncbi:MAG: glycosyltransferase [Flavobacteriaceae bacterium]|nr:glycosyltransferase [Flavobacteriaceae bacterium]